MTDDGFILLKNLQLSDEGIYVCLAKNKNGFEKETLELKIIGRNNLYLVPSFGNEIEQH